MQKCGVSNPSKDPAVKAKMAATLMHRYAVSHISHRNLSSATIAILTNPSKFCDAAIGCTVADMATTLKVDQSTIYRLSLKYQCRHLMTTPVNSYEQRVTDLLDQLNCTYIKHDRSLIAPYEIDIYLPDYKIGIEVGSVFYHSEAIGRSKNYHKLKWERCKQHGIELFQWFDQDLFDNWHITSSTLSHAVARDSVGSAMLYQLTVNGCTNSQIQQFLNIWHSNGYIPTHNVSVVVTHCGEIAAVMTIQHNGSNAVIKQWTTNANCSPLFDRMLRYWISSNEFTGTIDVRSDNRLDSGQLYSTNGFDLVQVSEPKMWYAKNQRFENKMLYQKHKLKTKFKLTARDMMQSAATIMKQHGYDRFWDAGYTLWRMTI